MSPNEQHLRAALHHGEGDRPDADLIIYAARERRTSRRRAVWAVAGSVAAVLAVGAGVTAASLQSNGSTASNGSAGGGGSAAAGAATSAARPPSGVPPKPTGPADTTPLVCPVALPSITPQPSSTGALVPDGIVRLRICLYQTGTTTVAGTTELSGAAATQFAVSLENSPPLTANTSCTADLGPEVVIIVETGARQRVTLSGNLGGCGAITNGPATRLARSLLQTQLHSLLPQLSVPGHATAGPGPS
jgi:hypothetical protein